jgi:hypothetical protein
LVCGDGKCAHIDIGKACNTNADCATGDCESGFAGDKCVCTDNEQCIAAYGADYNVCTDKDYDYHYCKTDAGDWKGPVNNPVQ